MNSTEKQRKKYDLIHRDAFLLDCPTYESYLDSFFTAKDLYFIPSLRSRRQMVKLGYRSNTAIYTRDEYKKKKANVESLFFGQSQKLFQALSYGLKIEDAVLQQLALREKANIEKNISTIIHLQDAKSKFPIYGYIDFEDSLRRFNLSLRGASAWDEIFAERSMLRPTKSDLSYYDSHTGVVHYNNTDNYNLFHSTKDGLTFIHCGDHKKICVNTPTNCRRERYYSDKYGFVAIYDHIVRRKI